MSRLWGGRLLWPGGARRGVTTGYQGNGGRRMISTDRRGGCNSGEAEQGVQAVASAKMRPRRAQVFEQAVRLSGLQAVAAPVVGEAVAAAAHDGVVAVPLQQHQ